jgi:hypothetical protein
MLMRWQMAFGKQSRSCFGSGFLFVQLEIFFGDSEKMKGDDYGLFFRA